MSFNVPSIELDRSFLILDNTGFHDAQTPQAPNQAGDTLDQLCFDDANRVELRGQLTSQCLESRPILVTNDGLFGQKTMLEGVQFRRRLAGPGSGPRAPLGVAPIRLDLSSGCHALQLPNPTP